MKVFLFLALRKGKQFLLNLLSLPKLNCNFKFQASNSLLNCSYNEFENAHLGCIHRALNLEDFCEFSESCKHFFDFSDCVGQKCICSKDYYNSYGFCKEKKGRKNANFFKNLTSYFKT